MYNGKYRRIPRERKWQKRPGVLLMAIVLLMTVSIGGTLAYLIDTTGQVTNTFTAANVEVLPVESTTKNSKSGIKFQNKGDVPVYIRAAIVVYWTDANGNVLHLTPDGGSVTIGDPNNGWTKGSDELYYYNSKVDPESWTTDMLKNILGDTEEVRVNVPKGYQCHVDIHCEAIQADGLGATSAQDAWAKAKGGTT